MFIIKIKKSMLVTYLGIVFAAISMYFAFTKMAFSDINYMRYSLVFLILSGICDMFDGKIARMCKRTEEEKRIGIEIDSLADTVNFIVLGMNNIIELIIYTIFILSGISRLAYFDCIATTDTPVKYYNGLPVTSTSIIYPILGLLHGNIPETTFEYVYIIATAIIALLFVLKIKVPKFKGVAYIIIPILAAILATLLLVIR